MSISEKAGTGNPEETVNKMLKFIDMRPISIKKHNKIVANMVPISITKTRNGIWEPGNLRFLELGKLPGIKIEQYV